MDMDLVDTVESSCGKSLVDHGRFVNAQLIRGLPYAYWLTDLKGFIENEFMATWGKDCGGKDNLGVWDWRVHSAVFKMDNQGTSQIVQH